MYSEALGKFLQCDECFLLLPIWLLQKFLSILSLGWSELGLSPFHFHSQGPVDQWTLNKSIGTFDNEKNSGLL